MLLAVIIVAKQLTELDNSLIISISQLR